MKQERKRNEYGVFLKENLEEWCRNNYPELIDMWGKDNPPMSELGITARGKKYSFVCLKCGEVKMCPLESFTQSQCRFKCDRCNSLGQHITDTYEHDALDKYWDYEKNEVDPFRISKSGKTMVWIKCNEKVYHGSYEIKCNNFYNGKRCPYCASQKVHPKDSFAQYHIDNTDKDFIEKYWSDKNTLDPFTLTPHTNKKVWIKCQYGHEDYEARCGKFTDRGKRCPICHEYSGEAEIRRVLEKNSINFIPQKTFDDLLGTGYGNLSYDFYIPSIDTLIEFQGKQHKEIVAFFGGEEKFLQQQEHDKRKREYADLHNIKLLEIWYYDYNNIEKILNKELGLS